MAEIEATDGDGTAAPPTRRRPLLVLWGVLAILAVGAGAIVVAAGDDDPPKLPITLGAGGGAGQPEAATAADTAMTRMAWIRYVAGDDLPMLGGDAPAARLSNVVDRDRLQAVADALGLDGELTEEPGNPGTWQLEAADGSRLGAGPYGGGGWWYTDGALISSEPGGGSSGSAGSSDGNTGSGVACAPDDTVCQDQLVRDREAAAEAASPPECAPTVCIDPMPVPTTVVTPPVDLPSKAEAERIALDLFAGLGIDVEGARVSTEGPHDAWYVSIEPLVEGLVVSGYVFNAAVGADGDVVTAGGVLNRPEGLGDYPTVDTRAAIDRLNEQSGGFGDGREPAIAQDTATATADVDCGAAAEAGVAVDPATDIAVDPVCEPTAPAEPTEVVLHEAERILVLVDRFDAEEPESYLVPGYRFRHDGEGWVDVISVDDDSLAPAPPAVEPLPAEPDGPMVPDPGGTNSTPGCAPVEPGPDGAVPDICIDPRSVDPGPATTTSGEPGGVEPSGPVSDPDAPVSSPVGEP